MGSSVASCISLLIELKRLIAAVSRRIPSRIGVVYNTEFGRTRENVWVSSRPLPEFQSKMNAIVLHLHSVV